MEAEAARYIGAGLAMLGMIGAGIGLGLFAMSGGLASLGFLGSAVSLGSVVALVTLEFVVAFLQAFVFAALTCVYLNDVVNLHSH